MRWSIFRLSTIKWIATNSNSRLIGLTSFLKEKKSSDPTFLNADIFQFLYPSLAANETSLGWGLSKLQSSSWNIFHHFADQTAHPVSEKTEDRFMQIIISCGPNLWSYNFATYLKYWYCRAVRSLYTVRAALRAMNYMKMFLILRDVPYTITSSVCVILYHESELQKRNLSVCTHTLRQTHSTGGEKKSIID